MLRNVALVGSAVVVAFIAVPSHARAASTITVPCTGNNTVDTTALNAAMNAYSSGDTITLAAGCTFSYASAPSWPNVGNTLIFEGNGDTITATVSGFRFFDVSSTGTFTISDIVISNASDTTDGLAIFSDGTTAIHDSTFSGNTATNHDGGAVAGEGSGSMVITGSTFTGNSAGTEGGAIENSSSMTIINSTFAGNSSQDGSAYIENGGTGTIINSTFAANTSDEALVNQGGSLTVTNSIVAENAGGDCAGGVTDGGYNNEDGTGCAFSSHFQNGNPGLGALAANGGPTDTAAITASSVAHGNGSTAVCAAAVPAGAGGVDQRGDPRGSGACDIGAFELQAVTTSPTPTPSPAAVVVPAAGAVDSGSPLNGPAPLLLLLLGALLLALSVMVRGRPTH